MALERYEPPDRRWELTPMVTITRSGYIGLNKWTIEQWEMDKWGCVDIYYDKDNRLIGLKQSSDSSLYGLKIKKYPQHNGSMIQVYCVGFYTKFDIWPEKTTRHIPYEGEDGMILIDLKSPCGESE